MSAKLGGSFAGASGAILFEVGAALGLTSAGLIAGSDGLGEASGAGFAGVAGSFDDSGNFAGASASLAASELLATAAVEGALASSPSNLRSRSSMARKSC